MNYSSLTQGASWGVCSPQAGLHDHYPLSSRIRGLLYTSPYGLSSLTAVTRSLYSASPEYLNLTHPFGRTLASNREIKIDHSFTVTDFGIAKQPTLNISDEEVLKVALQIAEEVGMKLNVKP